MKTPYSILNQKLDSLMSLADSTLTVHQEHNAHLDSLGEAITHSVNMQDGLSQQMANLSLQVQSISDFGIGYSDAAAHIAIPLIIALFAFAFPFLFTVITHINNKYNSEYITNMFSAEPSYKSFLWGSGISVGYLIIYGVMSLVLTGTARVAVMAVLTWGCVLIAGLYSAAILRFVLICIDYNNPLKIMSRVDYWFIKRTKKHPDNQYNNYSAESFRIRRLIDLCCYSIRKQDDGLFSSVVYKVNGLKHYDRNAISHNFTFFEDVLESYLYNPQNSKIEETLIMYWFKTFKKSDKPNLAVIYRMLKIVVEAAKHGRASLLETYLHHAEYGFRFIFDLPIVGYVRGNDTRMQEKDVEERYRVARELYEVHFIALAHLFYQGNIEMIGLLAGGLNTWHIPFIPNSGPELLRRFACCKQKQLDDGSFPYMLCDEAIGRHLAPDLLERFTAMLLLTLPSECDDYLCMLSGDQFKILVSSKDRIVSFGKIIQADEQITSRFPHVTSIDIKKSVTKYLKQLKRTTNSKVYDSLLDDSVKVRLEDGFSNLFYANQWHLVDGLVGEEDEGKTTVNNLGPYTYDVYKQIFTEKWDIDFNRELLGESRVFQSRYLFILYNAIMSMRLKEESVQVLELSKWIETYLGDRGEDYVIIDTGGSSHLLMDLDKHDGPRRWFDWSFKKAAYKHYDLQMGWYLKDLEEIEPFDNTVIIIKKTDLPYVTMADGYDGPSLSFSDKSNRNDATALVRITVNPNLAVRYNKDTEAVKIKVIRKAR